MVSVQAENKNMRGEAGDTMGKLCASQEAESGWVTHSAEPLGER